MYILFIKRQKIRSKSLVLDLEPGAQKKTIRLSSHTPEQFNVMSRTIKKNKYYLRFYRY